MTRSILSRPTPGWPLPAALTDRAATRPVVSLYLDTAGATEDTGDRDRLRWKDLRRRLREDGAPEAALQALDTSVKAAHRRGETLAAFATADGLLWEQHLAEPSSEGSVASVGPLPALVPLLAARQREIAFVVVATDRLGAELRTVMPDEPDTGQTVQGEELHITRSAPGGWSQRRFQQRAENRWEANAGQVAGVLTRLADRAGVRLVVATGDVRAVQFLRAALPIRVSSLLVEVHGDYGDLDNAAEQAHSLAADTAARQTGHLVSRYARELGQGDKACAGVAPVLAALTAGQAATVLLDPTRTRGQRAWLATGPAHAALDPHILTGAGAEHIEQAPLDDVLIHTAAATGAAVQLVPAGAPQLVDAGVGALLHYTA